MTHSNVIYWLLLSNDLSIVRVLELDFFSAYTEPALIQKTIESLIITITTTPTTALPSSLLSNSCSNSSMPTRIFHDEDGIIRDEQEEEGCERHNIRSRWIEEEEEDEIIAVSASASKPASIEDDGRHDEILCDTTDHYSKS